MSLTIGILSVNFNTFGVFVSPLEAEGFRVLNYNVFKEDINGLKNNLPDILFLDLHLGYLYLDGIEICERIKEHHHHLNVIIFSEEQEEYIQVEAYKAGADDFVSKKIHPLVIAKKMKVLAKRKVAVSTELENNAIHHLSIKINRESYLVQKGVEEISLQKKQFELLYLLISHPKKIFTRDELYKSVWKNEEISNPRIIDVHIRKIREKIGEHLILTIKGNGYKIES